VDHSHCLRGMGIGRAHGVFLNLKEELMNITTFFCDLCGEKISENESKGFIRIVGMERADGNDGSEREHRELCRKCIAQFFDLYFKLKRKATQ